MNRSTLMERYALLLGRLLIGGMFMTSTVVLVGGFDRVADLMRHKGIPFAAPVLVMTIVLWFVGAVSIISGYRIKTVSFLLFVVLIPATLTIHAPWKSSAASFPNELNNFLKNLAILGGLLYLATHGSGPLSVGKPSSQELTP